MSGLGALVGLLFGAGAYLLATTRTPWRARRFVKRVNDFLHPRSPAPRARLLDYVSDARAIGIAQRQRRAGLEADPSTHLLAIVIWCVSGLAVGSALIALLLTTGSVHQPSAALPLLGVCAAAGWLLAERRLDRAAGRRQQQAVMELPGVAESLALAVGAGAALPHAIELLVQREHGVLVEDLSLVLDDIRRGSGMDRALAAMHERLPLLAIGRLVDALRIALERGTPVVDVLHAQASDARNESRRLLMERAGRREIAMMVPVVFFVLPAVVVVSLFPGFRELTVLA